MSSYVFCVVAILSSLLAAETDPGWKASGRPEAPSPTFVEARANDAVLRKDYQKGLFTFLIDNYEYTVNGVGQLAVKPPGGQVMKRVTLDFPGPPLVTSIRYCLYRGDLLINYNFLLDALLQEANGSLVKRKVEQGRIMRLNKRTLRTKWVVINAPSDPPGVPIVADNSIYSTSVGIIGEIDLATGYYLWRHEDLTQKNGVRLFVFKVPRVTDNYVFFEEADIGLRRPRYTIQVKRRTGEIISMNYRPADNK
jgi:hypothetical protein